MKDFASLFDALEPITSTPASMKASAAAEITALAAGAGPPEKSMPTFLI